MRASPDRPAEPPGHGSYAVALASFNRDDVSRYAAYLRHGGHAVRGISVLHWLQEGKPSGIARPEDDDG